MSKRTASPSASNMIQQLMPLRDDPDRLHEALAGFDTVQVRDAVAQLLAIAAPVDNNVPKRRKLARISLSLPAEALVDVVLSGDRDTLDSMMLASRFMLDCIRKLETHQLALRTLNEVRICVYWGDDLAYVQYSLPFFREPKGSETKTVTGTFNPNLAAPCFPRLNDFVRLAYCKNVRIAFSGPARLTEERLREERDRIFANLAAQETLVDVLTIDSTVDIADVVLRSVQSFKSGTTVELDTGNLGRGRLEAFTEAFFVSLARQGVRSVDAMRLGIDVDVGPALAFGFAEPASGGRRELDGKSSELNVGVSFDFVLSDIAADLDGAGFEKYRKGDGYWLINDLENCGSLSIERAYEAVEIEVRSSQ